MDTTWHEELAAYRLAEAAADKSANTIRLRLSFLRRLALAVPVDATRGQLIEWLAAPEHEHWSRQTRASARSALVSFYGWRVIDGRSQANQAADLPKVRVPRRLPRPAPRSAVQAGLAADHPHVPLMVELAARAGLRRGEIARLRREDLGDDGLIVRGKGDKDRFVPVTEELRAKIQARPPGWLFPGRRGGHVSPVTVGVWVKRATGYSPHKFRHRFASSAYDGARNLLAVRELLGHASVETTQGYVAISRAALWESVYAAAAA